MAGCKLLVGDSLEAGEVVCDVVEELSDEEEVIVGLDGESKFLKKKRKMNFWIEELKHEWWYFWGFLKEKQIFY